MKNPGAIEEENINNPAYLSLLVNGVIGEFQPAFTSVSLYGAILSDEVSNWHGFSENIEIDNRSVGAGNGTASTGVYVPLQSTRFLADSTIGLLKNFLADTASRDVRLARVQAYAGYAYVLLAENMCSAPIGIGRAYSSEELLAIAVDRFKDGDRDRDGGEDVQHDARRDRREERRVGGLAAQSGQRRRGARVARSRQKARRDHLCVGGADDVCLQGVLLGELGAREQRVLRRGERRAGGRVDRRVEHAVCDGDERSARSASGDDRGHDAGADVRAEVAADVQHVQRNASPARSSRARRR